MFISTGLFPPPRMTEENIPVIILRQGRTEPLRRAHPWIFSGAVARVEGRPADGDRVRVTDASGQPLAWGHYHEGSIRVKVLAFGTAGPEDSVIVHGLEEAWSLRRRLGLGPATPTTGFRLVHGEGDFLPGLIVDIYGETAVFQAHSIGMHRERFLVADVLMALPDLAVSAVYDKSSRTLPPQYAAGQEDGYLRGSGTGTALFRENGLAFHADFAGGQKTGFFLDQRENRNLLARYATGCTVLNAFAYTGGFSIYALQAGAAEVHSVDVAGRAIAQIQRHLDENGWAEAPHHGHAMEVIPFLRSADRQWDVVVLDPPAFAKNLARRHQAVQGYKRLNAEGMKRVRDGGLLFTFSCSQVVDAPLFRDTIMAAALEANCRVRVLHTLSQGPDHPVNLALPESHYLKGLVLEIHHR